MVRVMVSPFTVWRFGVSPLACGMDGSGHFQNKFCGWVFCLKFASVFGTQVECRLEN